MKTYLDNIRKIDNSLSLKEKIIKMILIFILGILLGMFSKWLDNLSIDSTIWWQHLIEILDLNNFFSEISIWLGIALVISILSKTPYQASIKVFLFFLGMNISYHIYTIIFSGFNPKNYMMIWYSLTLLSPILGFISWYSKGTKTLSIIISSMIIFIMFSFCFNIGMWYFSMKSFLDTIVFIGVLILLYTKPRNSIISIGIGLLLAFLIPIPFFH